MSPASSRLPAIDWMRGLVMILMAVDHASAVFNGGRIVLSDSAWFGGVGLDLLPDGSSAQYLTRWVSHLCAPTFVFLAGTGLALSVERRLARGESAGSVDRHLIARGLLLIALEAWMSPAMGTPLLQVLYAIGAGMICMTLLRRLRSRWLLLFGLGWFALGEAAMQVLGLQPSATSAPVPAALTISVGFYPIEGTSLFFAIAYPVVPWLAIMALGWTFGRWLLARRGDAGVDLAAARLLGIWGAAGLLVFGVQRAVNAYGNLWLARTDDVAIRWLQVSKYPPSLAFVGLELGLMAVLLSLFFVVQHVRGERVRGHSPLLVLGRSALFFYVTHIHLLWIGAFLFFGGWSWYGNPPAPFGVASAWIGAAVIVVVLYPLCRLFRRYKEAHPAGWTRYF